MNRDEFIGNKVPWRMKPGAEYRNLLVTLKAYFVDSAGTIVWSVETPSKEGHVVPESDLLMPTNSTWR